MKLKAAAALLCVAACSGNSAGPIGVFGPVCGSSSILGVAERAVSSPVSRQCGIDNPVRVHEVAGVRLSQKPLLNCGAAKSLERWVRKDVKPSVKDIGERLESIRVIAHYTCRTRNNRAGGRISEHGKGNAIDIAGFGLKGGVDISVLRDWGNGEKGEVLSRARRAACGPFGVVLGPGSDRFHRDHFHLDVSNLGRPYCR